MDNIAGDLLSILDGGGLLSTLTNREPLDIIEFSVKCRNLISDKCIKLYELGYSTVEIASEVEIPKASVVARIKTYQKSLRDSSKYMARRKRMRRPNSSPYGFLIHKGKLVEHPNEQDVIQKILDLWKSGHGPCSIARELNFLGVKSRENRQWHHGVVSSIIRRHKKLSEDRT
jgi:hypothetical protein